MATPIVTAITTTARKPATPQDAVPDTKTTVEVQEQHVNLGVLVGTALLVIGSFVVISWLGAVVFAQNGNAQLMLLCFPLPSPR